MLKESNIKMLNLDKYTNSEKCPKKKVELIINLEEIKILFKTVLLTINTLTG